MPEALPSVRSGVARSEGTSQSGCPVRFTHSVAAGAERAASVLASVVAYVDLPRVRRGFAQATPEWPYARLRIRDSEREAEERP